MKTIYIVHLIVLLLVVPSIGRSQFVSISGHVSNSKDGKAMEKVSVFEANTEIGTITNSRGFFKLVLRQGKINLEIKNDGFQVFSKEMVLNSDTILKIKLKPVLINKPNYTHMDTIHAEVKPIKQFSNRRHIFEIF